MVTPDELRAEKAEGERLLGLLIDVYEAARAVSYDDLFLGDESIFNDQDEERDREAQRRVDVLREAVARVEAE